MITKKKKKIKIKMKVKKEEKGWNVRWVQDGSPRRYVASYWLEAIHFACAQLRAIAESCGSCYGAGASKRGRICKRCGGSGRKKEVKRVTERHESRLLRSLRSSSNDSN